MTHITWQALQKEVRITMNELTLNCACVCSCTHIQHHSDTVLGVLLNSELQCTVVGCLMENVETLEYLMIF